MTEGKSTEEISLQITGNRKSKLEELKSPGTVAIPESFIIEEMEIDTDVIQDK